MINRRPFSSLVCVLIVLLGVCPAAAENERPNLVIILSDDMGYSDIGCFGGEVHTPHLDKLAENGIRMMQFYNAARCCPTRASLMTGLHPHQAGIGWMTNDRDNEHGNFGTPAYRGYLAPETPTLAEVLGANGYATLMAGKWHLGMSDESMLPLQRGFDKFYGVPAGATNYFKPFDDRNMYLGNDPVETDEDFYFTDAVTDYAIQFVQEADAADDDQPFFLYLSYTAPHWPIQALKADIDRYRDRYAGGWDALRAERFERMQEMGLIDADWELTERDGPAWDKIEPEKQAELARRMAIYAAMIDRMDQNIGRVVAQLEALGELDNTLIIFLNDNGACAEGGRLGGGPAEQLETKEGYWLTYGGMWANASNTPYREYKHWTHEGGIATPTIVHWPAGMAADRRGSLNHEPGYLPDLMPTLLDAAGATQQVPPTEGVSLLETIKTGSALPERAMFWEHEGNAAVRFGDFKLVRKHRGADTPWELYNLAQDRTETHDRAAHQPELVRDMTAAWEQWAAEVGVMQWRGPKQMREAARQTDP